MEYELNYDSMDAVPEDVRSFYTEGDGGNAQFNIGLFNGLKTSTDVNNVQEALRKERNDHRAAQEALKPWKDLNPDEVRAQLDRIPTLEAAAEGKLDDDKINGIVEQRINQKTAPLNRQVHTLSEENAGLKEQNQVLQNQILTRDRNEAIRSIAVEMKVIPEAIPDVEVIAGQLLERTDDGAFIVKADANGFTPGADIKQLMKEMQRKRPYWWPQSQGGGAGGGGQNFGGQSNPWHADNWNMTDQARVVREQGMAVATSMAKAAGTTVGGTQPTKK